MKTKFDGNKGAMKGALSERFYSMKLSDGKSDPDPWMGELEDLYTKLNELGMTISEEQLKQRIIRGLPKDYDTLKTQFKKEDL